MSLFIICLQSLQICAYMILQQNIFNRMFFTLSATTVGQSRELSSSGRMVSKQWLNILSLLILKHVHETPKKPGVSGLFGVT